MSFFFHWDLGIFGTLPLPNGLILNWSPAGATHRDQVHSASIWEGGKPLLQAASIPGLEARVLGPDHDHPLLSHLQREILQHREVPPTFAGKPLNITLERSPGTLLWKRVEPEDYQIEVFYRGDGLFEALLADPTGKNWVSAEGVSGAEAVRAVGQKLPRAFQVALGVENVEPSTWWERL
jgi:hypothetical protein